MEITKRCKECGLEKPLKAFDKCFRGCKTQNREGYELRNPAGTVRNKCKLCCRLRERTVLCLAFYDAMGGKCECCGESDLRFLTLDHRNNDGRHERAGGVQNHQVYRRARREGFPKDRYAILCYNCNCAREHRTADRVCPHRNIETAEQYVARLRERVKLDGQKYRTPETGPRPWKSEEMKWNQYAKGHHHERKLTREQVRKIKEAVGKSNVELGKEFGVSWRHVWRIRTGRSWNE